MTWSVGTIAVQETAQWGTRGNGRENPKREARKKAAEQHTADVAARLAKDIARSLEGVTRYEGMPSVEVAEPCVPDVTVVPLDSVAAILENGRGYAQFCDLAVLDFASFVNPGGGYIRGGLAQEEALCTESYLYNVLNEQRDWYGENRRRNINCELYRERALVVPAVRFERGKMHAYADVVVAAAPNAKRARADYHVSEETLAVSMRDRVRFVLAIIDALGREKAVLGAYGCGVFGLGRRASCRDVPRGAGERFARREAGDIRYPAHALRREPREVRACV